MRRIAAPMVGGGVATAPLVTLLVLPVLFVLWHGQRLAPASKAGSNAER